MTASLSGAPSIIRKLRLSRKLMLSLAVLAATLVHGLAVGKGRVDSADSAEYLAAAYHLKTHGVYSESMSLGPPAPMVGREPGYPLLLSFVMRVDPAFHGFAPTCLVTVAGCGRNLYRGVILLNGLFIGLAGLLTYWLIGLVGGPALARWLGAAHIWLNFQGAGEAGYVMSDYLALCLEVLFGVLLVLALKRQKTVLWGAAGASLAALCLVKAIYLYFVPLLLLALGLARAVPGRMRPALTGVLALSLCFALPVGAWMARNASLGAGWVLSQGRTATVLSMREALDHMTAGEYLGGFLFWTRGFGDDLARAWLPPVDWRRFELYRPDGFYTMATDRAAASVAALVHDGMTGAQAEKHVAADMVRKIAARPVPYVLSTAPIFWRGIWIDEFIVLSLPALVWLCYSVWRRRRFLVLAALAAGLYSLLFQPLATPNLPRYQVTALPAWAIAFGLGAAVLIPRIAAWRRAVGLPA